jgi:cell division protein FtsQ
LSAPSEAKEVAGAPIDPRLRARRIAVRRDVGRRRLHRFAVLGIVVAVLGAVVALALSPLLDVDEVTVTGASHASEREVVAASGVQPGDQLVLVDRPGVVARVERLPWIRTASVERSWPSTWEISVVEREALVGFVGSDGRLVLADEEGRVLDVVAAGGAEPGVVVVTGPASPGTPGRPVTAPARPALEVARALPPEVADRVGEVAVEDDGTLTLLLEPLAEGAGPGPRVVLGDDLALDAKVSALATILARVDLAGVVTVDLQVPSAPALTRR